MANITNVEINIKGRLADLIARATQTNRIPVDATCITFADITCQDGIDKKLKDVKDHNYYHFRYDAEDKVWKLFLWDEHYYTQDMHEWREKDSHADSKPVSDVSRVSEELQEKVKDAKLVHSTADLPRDEKKLISLPKDAKIARDTRDLEKNKDKEVKGKAKVDGKVLDPHEGAKVSTEEPRRTEVDEGKVKVEEKKD